jgi:hypothetical protein
MPPRTTRKAAAPRAASPPPFARDASPPPIPSRVASPQPAHPQLSPLSNKISQVASSAPSPVAQTIPSAMVWVAFTAAVHLTTPPFPNNMQSISSVCKMSAIVLGIALALSSANIIPKLSHQLMLFVSLPLYILQSNFSRLSSLFLHSGRVTAALSEKLRLDLSTEAQQGCTLTILLLIIFAVFGKSSSGRKRATVVLYAILTYFIFTSVYATAETPAFLKASTTSLLLIFLAIHQFSDAPNAPAAYRNVFLANFKMTIFGREK